MQTQIPCVLMRGGSSKGPFFLASDLPSDPQLRDAVLIAALGSPHAYQVDGIGGGNPLSSKVAIISKSQHPDADVDYLFAQVIVNERRVDTKPNCGNMLIAVGPYAIEAGLVAARDHETTVRVHNVNTQSLIDLIVQTPGRRVNYEGAAAIDGVPGTAAPVKLNFKSGAGAVTGKLLPTGRALDVIDGIEVSCVDMAMPVIMMHAAAFGKTGHETPAELDADRALYARMEAIRIKAGALMGMGDVSKLVVPKVVLLAKPQHGGTISSRYFVPYSCHENHAVTGALCVAAACAIAGTTAAQLAPLLKAPQGVVKIEHPAGIMELDLDVDLAGAQPVMRRAALIRTARRLFQGEVLIPAAVWSQQRRAAS